MEMEADSPDNAAQDGLPGPVQTPRVVQRTYLILMLGNTLAASFIWGINTIFLLDAGLSNFEAFAANAFFTVGMVLFGFPPGSWPTRSAVAPLTCLAP